ncbi:DUF4043 domain-containing protein [Gluconacetobacter entanii]|uniref:DUF4043 domain-containing protein n=1 Tax=Gluconacetobacter entanii TaxID=108528 RepID=UPI001C932677|nr:DUF4043 domain-containing protein [Gluconacetobacter entanii]MBY4639659.1 DUF4043 domain-containing protein [Gluconacetobacter entanii]MCW4579645.1 DUF4043 domain-containing protein [Gluconacetobacter entanii]MCW4583051.1 DUF4043 domain-containing protein [Gluconacetobacter entanii]MCW4586444.1 DUF4043 domain-containing protein [Gluconacetobacter entanii]
MAISDFPAVLQPIVQKGMLQREFQNGLKSMLAFRAIADREPFPNSVGETITKTRKGLKKPVTTAMDPTQNTNLDNGLSPSTFSVEQYTLGIDMYGDTTDLNIVTSQVGIANMFLANSYTNGIQAIQSLERIARNALFFGNGSDLGGYISGNTRVVTALAAAGTTIQVDDIRGFTAAFNPYGQIAAVSSSLTMPVLVGSTVYTLTGVTPDATNVSTAPEGGISGTLTFTSNVSEVDGAAASPVVALTAPKVLRPNGKKTTAALTASNGTGDYLNMSTCLSAVAKLRNNNVPPAAGGFYHCYLDENQRLGLFNDEMFQRLYRGAYDSDPARDAQIIELAGIRFMPTTEAPQQELEGVGQIHRAIICGQGALIEGDFAQIEGLPVPDIDKSETAVVDGIAMVTRPPLDRLRQIIAQSWYWIGGFALPTDMTANNEIIPTATSSYLKRAVVIESMGLDD